MSIYLKLDQIKGNVTDKHHPNWIELFQVNFDMGRTIRHKSGMLDNRTSGLASVSELSILKATDEATPKLIADCFQGQCIGNGIIHFTETADSSRTYLEYQLSDIILGHYSIEASQDDTNNTTIETLKLNFTKMAVTFTPRLANNKLGSPVTAGFDLANSTTL